MADETDRPAPVKSFIPPVSETASAHAPFLYFEDAATFGHMNGVIQITLEALRIYSTGPENAIVNERVLVAHLRMNVGAALALRSAIDGAILLAAPAGSKSNN